MESVDAELWTKAMNEEIESLKKNGTWEEVGLPQGRKTVNSKWVFKVKEKADGWVERYKARVVAKGFSQQYRTDYDETYAPVARYDSFRLPIAIASYHRWIPQQMDVKSAFLYGVLKEEIYMRLPEGYRTVGKVASGKNRCVRTHRLRPDAPGARDALEAPWQHTYRSQCKTHRQCEFGRSSPWHHAPGRSSPRHLLTRRSVAGHFRSGRTVSGHFLSGRTLSGHFPSGRSRVRAFSFWTQPCQGIFLLDAAVSGHFPSGRSCVRANGIRTTRVMAPWLRWLSRHGTSQQILASHSQTHSGFQA